LIEKTGEKGPFHKPTQDHDCIYKSL